MSEYTVIHLVSGEDTIIDVEDYGRLSMHCWRGIKRKRDGRVYASRNFKQANGIRPNPITMHREICGLVAGDGKVVDHINGNTLDNRKQNLRVVTALENAQNSRKRRDNTTGYKGVWFEKRTAKYCAELTVDGRRIRLGTHNTAEDAYAAYCAAARAYHGEFARTA